MLNYCIAICMMLASEEAELIVSDMTVYQGEKGQETVEFLVGLSAAAPGPVTVEYNTENGTAIAGVDYIAAKGTVTFEPGELVKTVKIIIIGEVAAEADAGADLAPNINFQIVFRDLRKALLTKKKVNINIIKSRLINQRFTGAGSAAYVVVFKFTGFTTLYGDISNCPISKTGQVVLSGILEGNENAGTYDPIMYKGLLHLKIFMDICSVDNSPATSESFYCGLRVIFDGNVMTELEIDPAKDEYRGYINIHHDPATDRGYFRQATGGCLSQNAEETQMIPNKTIAAIFNGRELKLVNVTTNTPIRTLQKDTYYDVDVDGNVTEVRVVRKLR